MCASLAGDRLRALASCALLSAAAGCAMQVQHRPANLTATAPEAAAPSSRTAAPIHFRLSTGYDRTIPAMTEFVQVGEIPEGKVLRPKSYVLTVEGAHVHEAYLVVNESHLVGFYLPFERAFAPLGEPVTVNFVDRGN